MLRSIKANTVEQVSSMFEEYVQKHKKEISSIYRESLVLFSDELGLMKQQLSSLCVLVPRLVYILSEVNGFLIMGEYLAMNEIKDKKYNIEDKKRVIKKNVSNIITFQFCIENLVKAIRSKISVGQSLLKGEYQIPGKLEDEGYVSNA